MLNYGKAHQRCISRDALIRKGDFNFPSFVDHTSCKATTRPHESNRTNMAAYGFLW